jgi:sortase A
MLQGVAVPVEAQLGQQRLEQEFERQLAVNRVSPVEHPASAQPPMPTTANDRSPGPAKQRVRHVKAQAPAAGVPAAMLTVERLDISQIVLSEEATHEQLDEAPAMIKRGDAGSPVTVLAAHRDTHFLFIRDLRAGDEVTLQSVTGAIERYRVTHFETVRWDEFAYPLDPARPLLALATCYPFGGTEYGGPWRRVAWAERIG